MRTFHFKLLSGLLLCAGLLLPFRSHAAYNTYLSVSGVSGEATNGLIALTSFSWGVSVAVGTSGGTRSAGLPQFQTVTITKPMDISSPVLTYDCAAGTVLATMVITVKDQNTGNTLYTLTLGQVFITASNISSGGDRPSESYTLNFATIQWSYQKLDGSGNPVGSPITHNWNLLTNRGT